jgi:hypothetical protein
LDIIFCNYNGNTICRLKETPRGMNYDIEGGAHIDTEPLVLLLLVFFFKKKKGEKKRKEIPPP